jgi:NitT/TauT family transport system permease protein
MTEVTNARPLPGAAARGIRFGLVGQRLALLGVIIGIWWLASLRIPHYILPGPPRVYDAFKLILDNGDLWVNLGITLERVCIGFAAAALVSVPLGIMLGAMRRLGEFFEPVLPVLNTVSSAIWAIFAILWFGISNATTIFVVFMTAMPLIITNVWQGTRSVNADFIELAQGDDQDLPAYHPALFLFGRAARVRLRLARKPGRRNAGRLQRCRIPAAAGG